jgi:hypothetical protein
MARIPRPEAENDEGQKQRSSTAGVTQVSSRTGRVVENMTCAVLFVLTATDERNNKLDRANYS